MRRKKLTINDQPIFTLEIFKVQHDGGGMNGYRVHYKAGEYESWEPTIASFADTLKDVSLSLRSRGQLFELGMPHDATAPAAASTVSPVDRRPAGKAQEPTPKRRGPGRPRKERVA